MGFQVGFGGKQEDFGRELMIFEKLVKEMRELGWEEVNLRGKNDVLY